MLEYSKLADLRIKLDQLSERIVSKLKDRTRLPQNLVVYEKNGVKIKGRKGISLLEFALEGLEKYHASLGRFEYSDQSPLLIKKTRSSVYRKVPPQSIAKVNVNATKNILGFYVQFIKKVCEKGEDNTTFGETVYCDADLLELLNERISLGKFVAESKLEKNPSLSKLSGSALVAALRNSEREKQVVKKTMKTASKYDVEKKAVRQLFEWIIRETIRVEADYLKKRETTLLKK